MGRTARALKAAVQVVFYAGIVALLASRIVSAGISHDENQFIAPGQLLAYDGLLPYVDYPYTHMPYSIALYALSAAASNYDFLAGRLANGVLWLGCILLMVKVARLLSAESEPAERAVSWARLVWEGSLVYIFVNHGPALFILRAALNHSLATFFSLLALWLFIRGLTKPGLPNSAVLWSGACIAAAALTRFNFASLFLVLLVCWLIHAVWLGASHPGRILLTYAGGALAASLPALALAALAPRQFYYGNLVYIRLNTIYYQEQLHKQGMTLASKLSLFWGSISPRPLDLLLYSVLILASAWGLWRAIRKRSINGLAALAAAGMAGALWLSAFAPTPSLAHYFSAPLPFLFVLLMGFGIPIGRATQTVRALGTIGVWIAALVSITPRTPAAALAVLGSSAGWPPIQLHEFALGLRQHVPAGRILTLQPMVPLEAGYDVYPFTATGPFSWRTSPLLTAERRIEYEVTSPEELEAVLQDSPPNGILIDFEAPNAGFGRQDVGGLERPFSEYARLHGYEAVHLSLAYWSRGLTLWIRP